jgi:hypothetical protein
MGFDEGDEVAQLVGGELVAVAEEHRGLVAVGDPVPAV